MKPAAGIRLRVCGAFANPDLRQEGEQPHVQLGASELTVQRQTHVASEKGGSAQLPFSRSVGECEVDVREYIGAIDPEDAARSGARSV